MSTTHPTPLFLTILAGVGTALLSPLSVAGQPVIVLIIPFALIATYWYDYESGMIVGIGSSILVGILLPPLGIWNALAYALAAGISVFIYTALEGKKKGIEYLLLAAVLGTLAYEGLTDVVSAQNMLFRDSHFLGTNAASGIRTVVNVIVTWVGTTYALPAKK